MNCSKCGSQIDKNAKFCSACGTKVYPETVEITIGELPEKKSKEKPPSAAPKTKTVAVKAPTQKPRARKRTSGKGRKSRWTAFFFCLFLGWSGAHKFYVGKTGMGMLYLFTFGLGGLGWLYDVIVLGCAGGKDKWGRRLV